MIFHVCNILWRHNFKSNEDFWILKKVPESLWWCILWCATPRSFLPKSIPFDIWRNVDEKSKKHYDFKSLAEQFFFKLLLFLNEWSYWYQIGLKSKLIFSSFKKWKEGNFPFMIYHIGLEKIGLLMKIWITSWVTAHKSIQDINWTFYFKHSQKLLQNSFHLRPIWNL